MDDLARLRTFLAVYRARSVTRAADTLHLSQPAVTAHVKALETTAGRPLFVRIPRRGVSPTPYAHSLAERIAPHLDALQAIEHRLAVGTGVPESINVGAPLEMATLHVLPALAPLVREGLHVRIRPGAGPDVLVELADGALDLAVAVDRFGRSDLAFEPLFEEEFVLVGPPEWARRIGPAAVARAGPEALRGVPMVAYAEELPVIRIYWARVFASPPPESASVVVADMRAIVAAVTAGAGVSVLPRYMVADGLADGRLVELHRPPQPLLETVFLALRPGAPPPHVAAVADTLRRAAPAWDHRSAAGHAMR